MLSLVGGGFLTVSFKLVLNSWAQAILLPRPPEQLGPQVCFASSGLAASLSSLIS